MCDFLAKHRQESFPRSFQYSGKCEQDKIEKDHRKHRLITGSHCIDDFGKYQRRNQRCHNCSDHCGQDSGRQHFLFFDCFQDHTFYLSFLSHLSLLLPSACSETVFLFSISTFAFSLSSLCVSYRLRYSGIFSRISSCVPATAFPSSIQMT